MNGRQFFRALTNLGIPASIFATKLGSNLQSIYKLKQANTVPRFYLEALESIRSETLATEMG